MDGSEEIELSHSTTPYYSNDKMWYILINLVYHLVV